VDDGEQVPEEEEEAAMRGPATANLKLAAIPASACAHSVYRFFSSAYCLFMLTSTSNIFIFGGIGGMIQATLHSAPVNV